MMKFAAGKAGIEEAVSLCKASGLNLGMLGGILQDQERAMTEKPSETTTQKCKCAQHGEDNRRIEQGI